MYKILVVSDDETCQNQLNDKLEKWEYEVMFAKDGNEALNMLRTELFDLVMPEIHLQDTSGVQLMEQIHQEFKLPVILISADDNYDVMSDAIKKGAMFVFTKPFTTTNLKSIWIHIFNWRKEMYYKKGKGKQDPDIGGSSDENLVFRLMNH
ncbi:two-component response regulator ORR21-like [Apium graveolens]|uniref:two-component response regulator ORR21-like n=1 Tax=Apium graveolens TaxID=4045 RepID=UPI003D79AF92